MKRNFVKGFMTAAVGCILFGMAGCGSTGKTVNFEDYATVTFSGANGYGMATGSLDYDAIETVLFGEETDSDDLSALSDVLIFEDCIQEEVTPAEGLSNGDTVTYKIDIDEDELKEAGVKINVKDTEITYKVDGLTEVQTADVFSYAKVEYTGVAPFAKPTVTNTATEAPFSSVIFSCEDDLQVENGSTFTISANVDQDVFLQYGYQIDTDTYEYTAENVPSYVEKFDEISESILENMKQESIESIKQTWATQQDVVSYTEPEYCGAYFYLKNEMQNEIMSNKNNIVFLVFKATATTQDGTTEVYAATEYIDLVNGKSDVTEYQKPMVWQYTTGETTIASEGFMSYSVFTTPESIPVYAESLEDYIEEKVGL